MAVIEKETRTEYVAFQYIIRYGWTLVVSKNENPQPDEPTWIVKRLKDSGEKNPMRGFKKTYQDSNAINPKIYD